VAIHKPSWFSEDTVMVSTAPTCGLSRGGRPLYLIDKKNGEKAKEIDQETEEEVFALDDKLLVDAEALVSGKQTKTLRFVPQEEVSLRHAVPVFYETSYRDSFRENMKGKQFEKFHYATIGDLIEDRMIERRGGHGSPSAGERVGEIPYIKVSDLRAGLVNINPTNRVSKKVAERFWKGQTSGLRTYDIMCPERTSKNIGDFCILMPGQEQVVLTKEIIILRPGSSANFDPFYLLWAMTLTVVRDQWKKVVFMQTNREDVGDRYLEIEIPVPDSKQDGEHISESFRTYYQSIAKARRKFKDYLATNKEHHFFMSGAESES